MRSKIIDGFENYVVYEDGRILGLKRNKFLSPRLRGRKSRQYFVVALYDGLGNARNVSVHILVAKAFIPNPLNKPVVNHKDNNPLNNHIDNLEWVTHSENTIHSYKTDRGRGCKKVLQIDKKRKILIREFESLKQAQEITGIDYTSISKICNGLGKTAGGYIWRYKEE